MGGVISRAGSGSPHPLDAGTHASTLHASSRGNVEMTPQGPAGRPGASAGVDPLDAAERGQAGPALHTPAALRPGYVDQASVTGMHRNGNRAEDVPRREYPKADTAYAVYKNHVNAGGCFAGMHQVSHDQAKTFGGTVLPAAGRFASAYANPVAATINGIGTVFGASTMLATPNVGKKAAGDLRAKVEREQKPTTAETERAMSAASALSRHDPSVVSAVIKYGGARPTSAVQMSYAPHGSPADFNAAIRSHVSGEPFAAPASSETGPLRREQLSVSDLNRHRDDGGRPDFLSPKEQQISGLVGALPQPLRKASETLDAHSAKVMMPPDGAHAAAILEKSPELAEEIDASP